MLIVLLISITITYLHTVEEARGEIWDFLDIEWWLYAGFQLFVLLLGTYSIVTLHTLPLLLFGLIRIGDATFTHLILRAPGGFTAPLLVLDIIIILSYGSEQ